MYAGKTLFSQVMEFVLRSSFARIMQRYADNGGVRTLSCCRAVPRDGLCSESVKNSVLKTLQA